MMLTNEFYMFAHIYTCAKRRKTFLLDTNGNLYITYTCGVLQSCFSKKLRHARQGFVKYTHTHFSQASYGAICFSLLVKLPNQS